MDASERIQQNITKLIFQDSVWGYLFSRINRELNNSISSPLGLTINEDDGSIILIYNSNFIDLMEDDFLNIALIHEGCHIFNHHIQRSLQIISSFENNKDKILKLNHAADCAVNTLIPIKKSYFLKNGEEYKLIFPICYNLPDGKSLEYYYNNIPDVFQNIKSEKNGSEKNKDKSSNSNNSTNNFDGNEIKTSQNNNIDDHSQWTKNLSKISDVNSLLERNRVYTNEILKESARCVRGTLPGFVKEIIQKISNPPNLPYYTIISKLVKGSRLTKQKKAFTRINKKRVYSLFNNNIKTISPFPGKTKDFSFNISIILDTSGSMSLKDILEGLSSVKNIIENDKYCKTTILEIDTIIQKEYVVTKLKDIDYTIKGRGGTILLPALIRCKELNTDVTLVFTDGYCDNINIVNRKLLPRRIIYVITKDGSIELVDQTGFIVRLSK